MVFRPFHCSGNRLKIFQQQQEYHGNKLLHYTMVVWGIHAYVNMCLFQIWLQETIVNNNDGTILVILLNKLCILNLDPTNEARNQLIVVLSKVERRDGKE